MGQGQACRARFGRFELDLRAGELRGDGQPILLPEQIFQVLHILIERGGDLATREEIKKRLWPNDTVVEFDHSINTAIKNLRKALDDSADQPQYIETIPRRGYRLMVPVEWVEHEDSQEPEPALSPKEGDQGGAPEHERAEVASLTGRTVSHYRVLDIIGGGGMGVVYRAEDLKLGRQVALKFLPEELGSEPQALERFSREARAASSLDHPNICPIYEFGEHEGRPFIAMQLLEGQTLRDRLAAEEPPKLLPLGELLDIGIQVSEGLQAAHEKGIIHRDIKPANIFLTSKGVVKILDFGLAKLVEAPDFSPANSEQQEAGLQPRPDDDLKGHGFSRAAAASPSKLRVLPPRLGREHAQEEDKGVPNGTPEGVPFQIIPVDHTLTRTGIAMGTAGYMSPEQVRGEKLDARSDIFSFGLVLYEMATGQRAFTGETAVVVHDAILNKPPIPIRELNSALPAKPVTAIDKALENDRERRYQSAAEMRTDLERLQRGRQFIVAAPQVSRRWKWIAVAALVIALAVSGGFYWRWRHRIQFTDKDAIVVAHFQNLTGDAVIDDVLDLPLSRALQESPYLTVLYPSKVLDILRLTKVPNVTHAYAEGPKLTPELAREVCLRSNSKAFVTASIANAGNAYHIALNALNCHSGKTLAKVEKETNVRNEIVKTLGNAGYDLRRELGEPEDSLQKFNTPLEDETSGSLEALQAMCEGRRLNFEEGDATAASAQIKRAVELDPNFALAYMNLGAAYHGFHEAALAATYMRTAFNLRKRLSQRAQWFIEAEYYSIATGELEKANATFVQWIQTFPNDVFPHQNFAESLRALGQHERAAVEARESVRLLPNILTYQSLVTPLICMNRLEDAKAVVNEAKARGLDSPSFREVEYVLAFVRRDQAAVREQLTWAKENPGAGADVLSAQPLAEAYYGHFRRARQHNLRAIEAARRNGASGASDETNEVRWEAEAGVVGARQRAIKLLDEAPNRYSTLNLVLALARAGDVSVAERVADELDRESSVATVMLKFHLPTIRAAIELNKNNPRRAIELLQPTLPYEMAYTDSFDELWPAYVRGVAYLQAGDGQHAAAEFQKLLDNPGPVQFSITGAVAHLQLGRAQVMMGDNAAGRKSYQDFLTLWKDADPDIPIYKQAKAEYAKLK